MIRDAGAVRTFLPAIHAGLACSGAAALLYESAWTRMLHRLFGVSDLAVATVLACFFLGLGLGSALGGRIAARLRRPLLAYAALEGFVAIYAIASLAIVPALSHAYASFGDQAGFVELSAFRLLLAAVTLLPPTLAMGATLPILAGIARGTAGWSGEVTGFYVANTLGGVAGAALGGFWSIPQLGTRASISIAALLGIAAAAIVVAASRRAAPTAPAAVAPGAGPPSRTEPDASRAEDARAADARGASRGLALATALTALSGLTALAGEVVWTRVLRIIVHGTTTAFAAMLVNYLLGVAIGAWAARRIARRVSPLTALGVLQLAVVFAFAIAMSVVPHVPRVVPLLRHRLDVVPSELPVLLAISAVVLLPLAILTGTGLPLTWAIAEERSGDASRASGRLLAANTLGALLGSLGVAFFLVPALGVEATLLAIAGVAALTSTIALRASAGERTSARVLAMTGPLACFVAVLLLRPSIDLPFLLRASQSPLDAVLLGPDESWRENLVFLREGRNTTVTVRRERAALSLFNDGRPESGFAAGDPGFGAELATLGALPGLFAERTEHALIIGLGAGHTTSVALASGFERVTVVELEEAVVEASRLLYDARERPFPLDDPRAELVIDDARNRIVLAAPESLDAVISQPSHPWLAGSSALYTAEFFEEVSRALRPGGVLALWVNLFRMDVASMKSVLATLRDAFPHVAGFVVEETSLVLLAGDRPLRWDLARARWGDVAAAREFLAPTGVPTVDALAARVEIASDAIARTTSGAPRIEDDRPLLEFQLARIPNGHELALRDIDALTEGLPWVAGDDPIVGTPEAIDVLRQRVERVASRPGALRRLERTASEAALPRERRDEVLGAIAEARGDVGAALRAYDRAGTPESLELADRLRLAEGMLVPDLERALARSVEPARVAPLLEAALRSGRAESMRRAAELAARVGHREDAPLASAARAYADRSCNGLLETPELDAAARGSAALALLAARCALLGGDDARARHFEERAWRRRTVEANHWTRIGESAAAGGNGGLAWAALRRALATYPSNSRAAIALARLHARDGRPELARDVLADAWGATEGLDESRQRLLATAAELGIALQSSGQPGAGAEGSRGASASTTPPEGARGDGAGASAGGESGP